MKKIALIFMIISTVVLLGTSFKIVSPEELLVSPALNEEKRTMKDAIDSFRPPNSINYPVVMSNSDKYMSMINSDLDADSKAEIISFYKSKVDDKIGMLILKKVEKSWIKKYDIKFNTYEISELSIEDLNNNGKKELIVEAYEIQNSVNPRSYSIIFFNDNKVEIIKEVPNILTKIADINSDGKKEVISISKISSSDYVLNLDIFTDMRLVNYKKHILKNIKNPYNLLIGDIFENQKAILIDYMGDNKYNNTSILLFDKISSKLSNIQDVEKSFANYHFNLQSADIDNDGIIELAYSFKAPNYSMPIAGETETGLVSGYFKIKNDYTIELVKEIYEDTSLGYIIYIPNIFTGKYTLSKNQNNQININFINHQGKEYPLVQINYIKKYQWQDDSYLRNNMQLITENQDYVVAGKVLDYSEDLKDTDKQNYLQMRLAVQILSNVVKEKIY